MQVLALMSAAAGRQVADFDPYQELEEPRVWALYAENAIRQMWYRTDQIGAIAMLEAGSLEAATEIVHSLPMIRDGLLEVELVPLAPFTGIEALFADRFRKDR